TEPRRTVGDELGVGHGRRVERDLVGARPEHVAHLVDGAHAAADRQRDERAAGRPLDDVEERGPPLGRGGDVEEADLVGALACISLGELGRIALVDEVDEPGPLDDPPVHDVEARDDASAEHQPATCPTGSTAAVGRDRGGAANATKLASIRSPTGPLRSGWNCTPTSGPAPTALANGRPWTVSASVRAAARSRLRRPAYEWTK